METTTVLELIGGGIILNILLSSGVLWKVIAFAAEWGAHKKTVEQLEEAKEDHETRLRVVEDRR